MTGVRETRRKDTNYGVIAKSRNHSEKRATIVVKYEGMATSEEIAIIKFYNALVPNDIGKKIDIPMIVTEAFPKFEEVLGKNDFIKLKKYFGIGNGNPRKGTTSNAEVQVLLSKLRTIENAQYYIHGYKELIHNVASRLDGAPENMEELEKAKFLRMYLIIFAGYYYFLEDFVYVGSGENKHLEVRYEEYLKVNKMPLYPEELFFLYENKIVSSPEKSMLYDAICYELSVLDKRLKRDVLDFAELKENSDGSFTSVNKVRANQKFENARTLKYKVHTEPGVFPLEVFCFEEMIKELYFNDLYCVYKVLKMNPLESLETEARKMTMFEGNRTSSRMHTCYKICTEIVESDVVISGPIEAGRFIFMMEKLADKGFILNGLEVESGNGNLGTAKNYNVTSYLAAIKFAINKGYLSATSEIDYDLKIATTLVGRENAEKHLSEYWNGMISSDELAARLDIDEKFETEELGIFKSYTPENAAIKFALDCGYLKKEEVESSRKVITECIICGNENAFIKYAEGNLTKEKLKKEIGFDDEFSQMYFNLRKVDITAIEAKLQDLKRSLSGKKEIKRYTLLIALYCYIVDGQIGCGPKNKAPKRNRGLKTSNLRSLIE